MSRLPMRFQRQASGQGTVTDDGCHMFVASPEIAGHGHAQRGGNGRGGVPHPEVIAGAFLPAGKAGNAAVTPQRFKAIRSAGKDFPGIALMSHIPDDGIAAGVEHGKQRQGQFHHTEGGCEMPAVMCDDADDFVPQFLGKSLLFLQGRPSASRRRERRGGRLRDMAFP